MHSIVFIVSIHETCLKETSHMILAIPGSFEDINNSSRVLLPETLYNMGVYPGTPQKCDFNGEPVGC